MNKIKYPRTMNFPWSKSNSSDDVWWKECTPFEDEEVVMTEKLDGECTTIYPDGQCHARSIDTSHHPSRSWIKKEAARFAHHIPKGHRICGENLYAWHSIFYTELPTYFFVYGIYDNNNRCLSWEETEELCDMLDLITVPVIYQGEWNERLLPQLWTGHGSFPTFATQVEYPKYPNDFKPCEAEGYVVRLSRGFPYEDFRYSCAKYVRENHVTTPTNWMTRAVIPNLLFDYSKEDHAD
jgi:hypothetical protein